MNVVFTSLVPWSHHLATELELMEAHLQAGDSVTVLTCLGNSTGCVNNLRRQASKCVGCRCRRLEAFRLLAQPVKIESLASYLSRKDKEHADASAVEFSSVEHAQELTVDNWDVGFAALSTTIHRHKDPLLSTQEERDTWTRLLKTGIHAHRATLNFIEEHPEVERFYIFNGRFALSRGIFRACQQMGVDAYLHDRGSGNDKYGLFKNHLPHAREPFTNALNDAWEKAPTDERAKIGSEFFERRRNGVEDSWYSFTKSQDAGRLPKSWCSKNQNLVIFNSSEHEFVAIGKEWKNPIYPNQGEAIRRIVRDLNGANYKIYLRVHPNLRGVDNYDVRVIDSLDGNGIEIIAADSPVSTYDLIDASDRVLSFGSTTGVEATFWGKVSISAGLSFYHDIDATHNATSHEDVIHLLHAELLPKPRENALKYGYYLRTFGVAFQYYRSTSLSGGEFSGQPLNRGLSPASVMYSILGQKLGRWPILRRSIERVLDPILFYGFSWCNVLKGVSGRSGKSRTQS